MKKFILFILFSLNICCAVENFAAIFTRDMDRLFQNEEEIILLKNAMATTGFKNEAELKAAFFIIVEINGTIAIKNLEFFENDSLYKEILSKALKIVTFSVFDIKEFRIVSKNLLINLKKFQENNELTSEQQYSVNLLIKYVLFFQFFPDDFLRNSLVLSRKIHRHLESSKKSWVTPTNVVIATGVILGGFFLGYIIKHFFWEGDGKIDKNITKRLLDAQGNNFLLTNGIKTLAQPAGVLGGVVQAGWLATVPGQPSFLNASKLSEASNSDLSPYFPKQILDNAKEQLLLSDQTLNGFMPRLNIGKHNLIRAIKTGYLEGNMAEEKIKEGWLRRCAPDLKNRARKLTFNKLIISAMPATTGVIDWLMDASVRNSIYSLFGKADGDKFINGMSLCVSLVKHTSKFVVSEKIESFTLYGMPSDLRGLIMLMDLLGRRFQFLKPVLKQLMKVANASEIAFFTYELFKPVFIYRKNWGCFLPELSEYMKYNFCKFTALKMALYGSIPGKLLKEDYFKVVVATWEKCLLIDLSGLNEGQKKDILHAAIELYKNPEHKYHLGAILINLYESLSDPLLTVYADIMNNPEVLFREGSTEYPCDPSTILGLMEIMKINGFVIE